MHGADIRGARQRNRLGSGTCTDVAGNSERAVRVHRFKYDSTGPNVTSGKPARKPDHRGWYNRSVLWNFTGEDGLSGLAECPALRYSGPDGPAAPVIGACRDNAGNVSTRTFPIRYDDTPPDKPELRAIPSDGALRLRIGVASEVRSIRVIRAPGRGGTEDSTIYRGRPKGITDRHVRNGKQYRYTVVATDRAGNRSRGRIAAVPGPRLLSPPHNAVLTLPPLLRWTKMRDADYFNLQLRRDGVKVLSEWPARPQLQLRRRWMFQGPRPAPAARALRVGRVARLREAQRGELRLADRRPDVRHPGSTRRLIRSSTGSLNEHEP